MMNFKKKEYAWYFLASIAFYIAAIIAFITGENTAMGVCWLCLGSSNLCFGAAQLNKYNKSKEEGSEDEDLDKMNREETNDD